MLKLLVVGALAVPVAAAGVVAATGVAVVDVREAGGGHHIVVPVPLVLAQAAAAFVPAERTRVHLDHEALRHLPLARQALAALAEAEDAELVRVEEPGQHVSIRKEGRTLQVHVDDRGEQVDVTVPIDAALSLLPDDTGRITASDAVWALQQARFTRVVDVHGRNGDQVRVTIY